MGGIFSEAKDVHPSYIFDIFELFTVLFTLRQQKSALNKLEIETYLIDSTIMLNDEHTIIEKWVQSVLSTENPFSFSLLWRGSRDGFTHTKFHENCDNKGPTIVIVKAQPKGDCEKSFIFGGYCDLDWNDIHGYKRSSNAFIFTLTNPNMIPPTMYMIVEPNYAVQSACKNKTNRIMAFGKGADFEICDNCNIIMESYTHFPSSYWDTTNWGRQTFIGLNNSKNRWDDDDTQFFLVQEIEVFALDSTM